MRRVLFATATIVAMLVFHTNTSGQTAPATGTPKDATVLGFKIHYLEAGQGAPLVLLHGLGGDGSRWAPNIGPLARDFRVLAVDQIGFGQSDKPLANYHGGMLAEFVAGFMKAIGVPRASLVGNSMGAGTATYMAVHFPQMVEKLVLVDGAGYRRRPTDPPAGRDRRLRQIQNSVTREETREFFRVLFYHKTMVTDAMVDEQLAMRLRSAFAITKIQEAGKLGLGGVTEEEMRSIKAPTLIVWGRYDELASPTGADRLNKDIVGSHKVLIDLAGHMPQLERADEFNRLVREFIKEGKVTQ